MSSDLSKTYMTHEEIRNNKIKSVALIALMAGIILLLAVAIGYYMDDVRSGLLIGVVISAVTIPVQLLTGKLSIIGMTRGRKADPLIEGERRVISAVENLSISAGLRETPDVYIIPSEAPNAFASGMSEKSAFIGVTEGLLEMLDDQELSGVVGHEISHIVHRDIMLSQISVALVSIILMLSNILYRMGRRGVLRGGGRSKNSKKGNAGIILLAIALVAIVIRPLANLIANLIQLSISRKREYAADAYAVRLCGYSEGLARALEKIGGQSYDREIRDELGGSAMRSLYIAYPEKSALFSSHPPIGDRVVRIRNMY